MSRTVAALSLLFMFTTLTTACSDDGDGGGADAGARDGGGDAGASDAAVGTDATASACEGTLAVTVDGTRRQTCMGKISPGGLNHVSGILDDGSDLIVNFSGQSPAAATCVSITMRKPGSTVNDWGSGTTPGSCMLTVSEYGAVGQRVKGTFSATLKPITAGTTGDRTLTGGSFDVLRP